MKIGLNGQRILMENPAGPEKFTINLFKTLSKVDNKNNYIIYFDKEPEESFFTDLALKNPNFSYKTVTSRRFWTQVGLAKELIKNPVDVFFTAVHTIPIIRSPKTKYVSMIHGLEYMYTAGYKNPLKRLKIDRPIKYTVKNSDKIVVPTQATKDQILKSGWEMKNKEIEIIGEGVSDIFYKRDEKEINEIRKKYELGNDPYLLFVSTIQPRKNIPNMVEAFGKFIKENPKFENIKLLIAGKKGWDYEESIKAPQKFGVEENVKFLGRIPDEDSPILFSGAVAHINVSFEEGFGLPLLEALACGTLSVVSDIPPYHEVGGILPIFVNPNDVENIKEGIAKVFENKENTEELIQRSKLFTWEKTAEKLLQVMNGIY